MSRRIIGSRRSARSPRRACWRRSRMPARRRTSACASRRPAERSPTRRSRRRTRRSSPTARTRAPARAPVARCGRRRRRTGAARGYASFGDFTVDAIDGVRGAADGSSYWAFWLTARSPRRASAAPSCRPATRCSSSSAPPRRTSPAARTCRSTSRSSSVRGGQGEGQGRPAQWHRQSTPVAGATVSGGVAAGQNGGRRHRARDAAAPASRRCAPRTPATRPRAGCTASAGRTARALRLQRSRRRRR